MSLVPYFTDISEEMRHQSERVRRDFASHRPSAGSNRESVIGGFLRNYLPQVFGIDTGLILAQSGEFSNQADLIIVDQSWNAPLYPTSPNRIWLIESVYALIEVKTYLSPSEIKDAVSKCRRFKQLPRQFDDLPSRPKILDSLFVLWGFEGSSPTVLKQNIIEILNEVPRSEQPDLILIPGSVVIKAGHFHEITQLGMPGSLYRTQLEQATGTANISVSPEFSIASEHSLLIFLDWFVSWLKGAGNRSTTLRGYIPSEFIVGHQI